MSQRKINNLSRKLTHLCHRRFELMRDIEASRLFGSPTSKILSLNAELAMIEKEIDVVGTELQELERPYEPELTEDQKKIQELEERVSYLETKLGV